MVGHKATLSQNHRLVVVGMSSSPDSAAQARILLLSFPEEFHFFCSIQILEGSHLKLPGRQALSDVL